MKKNKNIVIENARILFRNFGGAEGQFNPAGRRNFCVIIDEETAATLQEDGWNVKYLQPRDDLELPQPYLQVGVSYNAYPPKIVVVTSRGKTLMTEDTISALDWAEIENVDLIIRPYSWEVGGKSGIKAYVSSMYITLVEDELELKYANVPDSGGASNVGGCGNCDVCDGHCHDH